MIVFPERPVCLCVLFFSFCSSRNVTPYMKVTFQWNINIIARRWRSMYIANINFAASIIEVPEFLFFWLWCHWKLSSPDLVNGVTMSPYKQLQTRLILFLCYVSNIICSTEISCNLWHHCKTFSHWATMQMIAVIFVSYWNTKQR